MSERPPPSWYVPTAGALPGAAAPGGERKRLETLGTVCLALSGLELLYCMQRLVGPLFARAMLQWQTLVMPRTAGGPSLDRVMEAAQRFSAGIMAWEVGRTAPFVIATVFLLKIALRLRRGEAAALGAARAWTWAALGVVALSLLIQLLVIVPATLAYERSVVALMPSLPAGAAAPPFDIEALVGRVTVVATALSLIGSTVLLAAWPVVLQVWAARLQRQIAEGAAAEPPAG